MILRLALRSLAVRPARTAVLAAGFGLGIAVMAALLGVGEVIIEQAHSPALRGGGDLVVSGAMGPIENARYLLADVLGGPALEARRAAASPSRRSSLYLIKAGKAVAIHARAGIPSLEKAVGDPEVSGYSEWSDTAADAEWSNPRPESILRAMDRFHPMPSSPAVASGSRQTITAADSSRTASASFARRSASDAGFSRSSWAEWLYFNGRSADGRLRFYLTFLAGPESPAGTRGAFVRLQLERDGHSTNYAAGATVDAADMLARAPELDIAGNRVRLDGARYRLTLDLAQEPAAKGGPRLTGEIVLDAPPGRSLPPTAIRGANDWVSGYVVPVLSGALHGTLRIGGDAVSLDGATGYHDHNWGFWEGVRWQWGQVASGDLSIVYGRVFPPATVADAARVPGVLGVLGPSGPIGFATDIDIAEQDAGGPRRITITARGQRLDLTLALTVDETVTTRMALTRMANGETMNFLQLGGTYQVSGQLGDRTIDFTARGAAETFRASPNPEPRIPNPGSRIPNP